MNSLYFSKIATLFDQNCQEFESSIYAVGWVSKETQRLRFDALLSGFPVDRPYHILDVGAGQGEFLAYLQEKGVPYRYTGIDISPKMIHFCQKRFPAYDFKLQNALEIDQEYDFVVASGIFCHKHPNPLEFANTMMRVLFQSARIGMAFNALTTFTPQSLLDTKNFQYFYPPDLLTLAYSYSKYVKLNQSYLPNDVTLQLMKGALL